MFLQSLSFSYPRFRFSESQLALSHRDKGLRVVPRLAEKSGNGGQSRGAWNTAAQFVKRGYAAKAPLLFGISRFYNWAGNNKKSRRAALIKAFTQHDYPLGKIDFFLKVWYDCGTRKKAKEKVLNF